MPGMLLDLSAIAPAAMTVTGHDGTQWVLRDCVPAETLLRGFDLLALDAEYDDAMLANTQPFVPDPPLSATPTPEEVAAAREQARTHSAALLQRLRSTTEARIEVATELAVAIVQASYPHVTAAEVAETILPTLRDRRQVVTYFFAALFFASNGPSSGSTPPDAPTTPSGSEQEAPSPSDQPVAEPAASAPSAKSGRPTTTPMPRSITPRPSPKPALGNGHGKPNGKTTSAPASTASRRPTSMTRTATGPATARPSQPTDRQRQLQSIKAPSRPAAAGASRETQTTTRSA